MKIRHSAICAVVSGLATIGFILWSMLGERRHKTEKYKISDIQLLVGNTTSIVEDMILNCKRSVIFSVREFKPDDAKKYNKIDIDGILNEVKDRCDISLYTTVKIDENYTHLFKEIIYPTEDLPNNYTSNLIIVDDSVFFYGTRFLLDAKTVGVYFKNIPDVVSDLKKHLQAGEKQPIYPWKNKIYVEYNKLAPHVFSDGSRDLYVSFPQTYVVQVPLRDNNDNSLAETIQDPRVYEDEPYDDILIYAERLLLYESESREVQFIYPHALMNISLYRKIKMLLTPTETFKNATCRWAKAYAAQNNFEIRFRHNSYTKVKGNYMVTPTAVYMSSYPFSDGFDRKTHHVDMLINSNSKFDMQDQLREAFEMEWKNTKPILEFCDKDKNE